MYDEAQPMTTEPSPSPAHEGQSTETTTPAPEVQNVEKENDGRQDGDHSPDGKQEGEGRSGVESAGKNGKITDQPPAQAPPTPAKPPRPPSRPPRTPEQKAVDDAIEAHKKTGQAIEVAKEKLAASERAKAVKKGREVVLARIERMDVETRAALVAMLPSGSEAEESAMKAYLVAVQEEAEIAAEKLAAQPKQE